LGCLEVFDDRLREWPERRLQGAFEPIVRHPREMTVNDRVGWTAGLQQCGAKFLRGPSKKPERC
jgi:hypothetical protein